MLLQTVAAQPSITQQELAWKIGKFPRTAKSMTVRLQEKGSLIRENGKRYGRWVVNATPS